MNHWPTHGKSDNIETESLWGTASLSDGGLAHKRQSQLAHGVNREEQVSMRLTVLPRVAGRKFRGN